MTSGVSQTFTVVFPTRFTTTPQFTVLPTRWKTVTHSNPAANVETIQLTFSSLTTTGFTLTILVTTQADEFHLYWAATVGQYLQLFNFAMTQNQFTDITGVPTLYQLPFDSSQVAFGPGTENVLVTILISSFSRTYIPDPTSPVVVNLGSQWLQPSLTVTSFITSTSLRQIFLEQRQASSSKPRRTSSILQYQQSIQRA
jgi:hypothetical protein